MTPLNVVGLVLATLFGVSFVPLFAVWLGIVDPEPSGCSGHHFEERRKTGSYKVRCHGYNFYTAEKEVELRCQHSGCSETKTKWRRISGRVEKRNASRFDTIPSEANEKVTTDEFEREGVAREVLGEHISSRTEGAA